MNKLLGFFELQRSGIPTIPWKEFRENSFLDNSVLWTIRTAVLKGNDLNLPRMVGENSNNAYSFAKKMLIEFRDKGMVIYYPYFIAIKSGTLNVYNDKIIIEAVKDDLWNLVTYSDREVTIRIVDDNFIVDGNKEFLTQKEIKELMDQIPKIKSVFRDYLIEGKSILLEWSFAYNCDIKKEPIGNKYLVFYEARTV
ncbi:MAG: hypothetical protein K0R00_461 [Herbinix sp.]|jgi:hypothetical protein|nr:hypothetical protein [Herbinix sp.]